MNYNVTAIRSDNTYKKIATASPDKKEDIYRFELMKPFEKKWEYYHIPLKAKEENGYDIILASNMLGFQPPIEIDESWLTDIHLLASDTFWDDCKAAIHDSLSCFTQKGIELPVKDYRFTILLANPDSPYTKINDGYCGDGGIPGYIFAWLQPTEFTMKRLPVALAHETNHNVRFQFIKWRDDITLAEMMVNEGLAENFATSLYGEENLGPWVSKTNMETLNNYIKPIIRDGLDVQGLDNLTAYLYGDEMALMQNYFPVGLPYCAGYACGYHMIKYYLRKTEKSIIDATLTPAKDILKEIDGFWEEDTR
ncbi:DUF2268 domain-containing protein [Anaerosporobacter sp.]|uniref:DUF2268 domain-containing protein n=1 Tax=Anaerosporobacter sp. TaxID=1872529 RepID=UPI00286EBD12|nr:DUF2268 domain-containing protein [Anaerosporobacter sp.]